MDSLSLKLQKCPRVGYKETKRKKVSLLSLKGNRILPKCINGGWSSFAWAPNWKIEGVYLTVSVHIQSKVIYLLCFFFLYIFYFYQWTTVKRHRGCSVIARLHCLCEHILLHCMFFSGLEHDAKFLSTKHWSRWFTTSEPTYFDAGTHVLRGRMGW